MTRTSMVVIILGLKGLLPPSSCEVEVICEGSSDFEGLESLACCNCIEGEIKTSVSLTVSRGSKSVS